MDELSKALFDFAICIEQFISHFPDEKRAPLTAESVDWDEYIIPYRVRAGAEGIGRGRVLLGLRAWEAEDTRGAGRGGRG